jgi:hypothetical protein
MEGAMMLTPVPFLLIAIVSPISPGGSAQADPEDPSPAVERRAVPPLSPWAARMNLTLRFPGGMGVGVDVSRAFGEVFSIEGAAGAGDYGRTDLSVLARVTPPNGGITVAAGPLLMLNDRVGPVVFVAGEFGYSSNRRRGIFVLLALGAEVALNESGRAECQFLDLACPGKYRPGEFNFRSRVAIGAAF